MEREKTFAKNTIIIFIGTLCTKLMSFLLLPLYTGFLTPSDYGTLELLNTIISLLVPIISLHIDQGTFRYLVENRGNEKKQNQLISSSFILLIILLSAYLLIFFLINPLIINKYKYLLIINIIFNSIITLLLQISRGLGDNKNYSISSFFIASITIFCNIFFLVSLHLKISGMLISTIIGEIIGILYLIIKLKIYNKFSIKYFNINSIRNILKYSIPLIPSEISWWIFSVSDRFIVSIFLGLTATGILSVSYKLSSIYIVIYNIINLSLTEIISLHIKDKDIDKLFNNIYKSVLSFFTSIGILLIAFMPIIFKILINSKYNMAYNLIPIAIIASILQVIVGLNGTIYAANKNTKALANTSIISSIVNLSIDLLLIKQIGLYAAVISTLISYLVFAIYRTYDINKKYFKININIKKIIAACFFIAIILLSYYNKNIYIKILAMIISSIYAIILNKDNLSLILSYIQKKKIRRKI